MGLSLTGLGIVPYAYLATGFPRFAEYPFHPAQGWLGIGDPCENQATPCATRGFP